MNPPLADTVIPGGGLVVAVETGVRHAALGPGVRIVAPLTPVIFTMGFAPGVPPEYGMWRAALEAAAQLLSFVVGFGHVAVATLNTSCRNTRIDLDTPAAPPAESSTRITNENVPGAVGLPVVLPPFERARPDGSAPELIDHL